MTAAVPTAATPWRSGNRRRDRLAPVPGPALPAPDATRASIDGEHGGLTLSVPGHTRPGAPINPYGSVKDAAALNDAYEANNAVLRDQGAPYGLSGSVYTQIADVEGE